jgi:hypothetical protein
VGRPDTVVADVPYGSEHRHGGLRSRGDDSDAADENAGEAPPKR